MFLSKGVQGLTALSGFLYSQKLITDKKKFYVSNLWKLLTPALICLGIMAVWDLAYFFINQAWDSYYYQLWFDHRVFNNGLLVQPGNYYYIAYIFGLYLITPFIQDGSKRSNLIMLGISIAEIVLAFFFGQAIILSCYFLGYVIGKKYFENYTKPNNYKPNVIIQWTLILLLSIGGYVGSYFLRQIGNLNYIATKSIGILDNLSMTIFGVATFFFISSVLLFANKVIKKSFLLTYSDKVCYTVYLLNQSFMCGAMNVTLWSDNLLIKYILVYAFTIGTAIVVYLIDKYIKAFKAKHKEQKLQS